MGRSQTGGFHGGLARGGQKRGLQADFQAAIAHEIETLLGRQAVQGLDFEALETAARQQALHVAARVLEGWLNADTSDHTGSHLPCACGAQTGEWLKSVVQSYFNYYAVPGNLEGLAVFRDRTLGLWWRTLRRRSQKHRFSWKRTLTLGQRWLPSPRVLHPYPADRFAASQSTIRTGCANQRSSRSGRVVP